MKGAPFSTIVNFRKKKLRLSLNSPSIQSGFVLGSHTVMVPDDLAPWVPTHPAAIYIHVDIHLYITMDVHSYIRCRD